MSAASMGRHHVRRTPPEYQSIATRISHPSRHSPPEDNQSAVSVASARFDDDLSSRDFRELLNYKEGKVTQSLHELLQTCNDTVLNECIYMSKQRNQEMISDLDTIKGILHTMLEEQREERYQIKRCRSRFKHYKSVMKELAKKVGGISQDVSDSDTDSDTDRGVEASLLDLDGFT